MIHPRLLSAFLLLGLVPALAEAQTPPLRFLAFGDSITEGRGDDPQRARQGYPPRLEALLQGAGVSATVLNFGEGGERTPQSLRRINQVLNQFGRPGDVLLLMEGTNDVSQSQDISLETTIFNLDEMAGRAETKGLTALHATIIPRKPDARRDPQNFLTDDLNGRIRNLAALRNRREADPYEVLRSTPNLFGGYYAVAEEDPVGHPNPAGYDLIARVFFEAIQGIDTVPPVPGILSPINGATGVPADTRIEVDVLDFGAGIDLASTFLLVNGNTVSVVPTGDSKRAHLSYLSPTPLSGVVSVGLRSRDLATTPNTVNREIARFTVAGASLVQGDLNRDGRVDGTDLVIFAIRFGTQRGNIDFRADADFTGDGHIDGMDLAILASNFGRSV